jgi:hypothetical protein
MHLPIFYPHIGFRTNLLQNCTAIRCPQQSITTDVEKMSVGAIKNANNKCFCLLPDIIRAHAADAAARGLRENKKWLL